MERTKPEGEKEAFRTALTAFVSGLGGCVSDETGQWTVKGFIDIFKSIYTISSDTKVISKVLEIHLFPLIQQFALDNGYSIILAEQQNWYPDLTFVKQGNESVKFAVDLKTTYRDPDFLGHVNGFTLGSHGAYFKDRTCSKNIQFPYSAYVSHFCLGIIYSRVNDGLSDPGRVMRVMELEDCASQEPIPRYRVTSVDNLRSIGSAVKDFQFFVCEKWRLASDRPGSGNTANIGSITYIDDIVAGNGVFARLGERCFDEYWMNYGVTTMMKDGKATPIRRITDFVDFKGEDRSKIVPMRTKRRARKDERRCE